MQILSKKTKFAHLGKPGTAFTKGFQRRLDLMKTLIDFKGKKILDLGTGEGVWLEKFAIEAGSYDLVYASEFDPESLEIAKTQNPKLKTQNLKVCPAENLEFSDNFFDVVFQNEVLEHVKDDQQTLNECYRVLKPGGTLVFFTPNSGWPFEQHGIFIFGKYIWGNIPLLPWMPKFVQRKFAPHVRNFGTGELDKKLQIAHAKGQTGNFKLVLHTYIFSGFDGLVRRFGIIGKLVQSFFFWLEKTPFKRFGISHFVIAEKA